MSTKRDFLETERTPGWEAYKAKVEEAIAHTQTELHSLEIEGKTADQIGVEHIKLAALIDGLKRALGIAEDIKKEPADDI